MEKRKKIILRGAALVSFLLFLGLAKANAEWNVKSLDSFKLPEATVAAIITNIATWLLTALWVISVGAFVVSGIMYLISAGNDEMITKAKKYMLYCLVGITVALASYVVVKAIDTILNAGGSAPPSSSPFTSV